MLRRALKMAFWVLHDHLGKLLLVNLIVAVAVPLPIVGVWPFLASMTPAGANAALLGTVFLSLFVAMPVLLAGTAELTRVLIETRDGTLDDFARGIRRYGLRAASLGCMHGVAAVLLGSSAWFYATAVSDAWRVVGLVISIFALWCLACLCLTALFALPALIHRKGNPFQTVRLAFMVAFAHPGISLGLGGCVVGLLLLTALFWPLYLGLLFVAPVVLVSAAYEVLARKYGSSVAPPDAEDDYLNRGLRDLLFPWRG